MTPDWSVLEIDIDRLDAERLLGFWRWLVPEGYVPFSMTVFGDWFLEGPHGQVYMLDLVAGRLNQIAGTRAHFDDARTQLENLDEWYMMDLACLCHERGIQPAQGECLSYKIPPVLSGKLEPENIETTDISVHQAIMAQIHQGVRDLPAGTPISHFTVDGEEP